MPLPLVIFDCDGVLVDSEPIASRVLAEILTDLGFPLSPQEAVDRYTGISMAAVVDKVEAEWGHSLPRDFVPSLHERDLVAFRAELKPVPGVHEMLETLAALGLPTCVASSGAVAKLRVTLGVTGLLARFEPRVFSAEMVPRGKPEPDLFLYAAERMAAPAPTCVVVEDSVAGIHGALAAGMAPFGFAGGGHAGPGYGEMLRDAGAMIVFHRMEELAPLLERRFLESSS